MKLYDVKSRERKSFSVQMEGPVPNLPGVQVTRMVMRLDRTEGKLRPREETKRFPPAITWQAGEVKKGLPAEVLANPVIASKIRRRRLVVLREYDSEVLNKPEVAELARKRTRRRGAKE